MNADAGATPGHTMNLDPRLELRTRTADSERLPFMRALMTSWLRRSDEIPGSGVRVRAEEGVGMIVDPVAGSPYVFELPDKLHTFESRIPGEMAQASAMRQAAGRLFDEIVQKARARQSQSDVAMPVEDDESVDSAQAQGSRDRAMAPRG